MEFGGVGWSLKGDGFIRDAVRKYDEMVRPVSEETIIAAKPSTRARTTKTSRTSTILASPEIRCSASLSNAVSCMSWPWRQAKTKPRQRDEKVHDEIKPQPCEPMKSIHPIVQDKEDNFETMTDIVISFLLLIFMCILVGLILIYTFCEPGQA